MQEKYTVCLYSDNECQCLSVFQLEILEDIFKNSLSQVFNMK